jgi:hypothetical protein
MSTRAIPSQMAASISPCVFMVTSNVSQVPVGARTGAGPARHDSEPWVPG